MSDPTLNDLGVKAQDVSKVEQNVLAAAEAQASAAERSEHDTALATLDLHLSTLRRDEHTLEFTCDGQPSRKLTALRARIATLLARREKLIDAHAERKRLAAPQVEAVADDVQADGETRRDFLIRTGRLTPFQGHDGYERRQSIETGPTRRRVAPAHTVDQNVTASVLSDHQEQQERSTDAIEKQTSDDHTHDKSTPATPSRALMTRKRPRPSSDSEADDDSESSDEEPDYVPSDDNYAVDADEEPDVSTDRSTIKGKKSSKRQRIEVVDDSNERPDSERDDLPLLEGEDYVLKEEEEVEFDGGLRVPGSVYDRLFDYQKTAVRVFKPRSLLHLIVTA